MAEVALRWVVHHSALKTGSKGGNDGVIIGISKIEQLDQNIHGLGQVLCRTSWSRL